MNYSFVIMIFFQYLLIVLYGLCGFITCFPHSFTVLYGSSTFWLLCICRFRHDFAGPGVDTTELIDILIAHGSQLF